MSSLPPRSPVPRRAPVARAFLSLGVAGGLCLVAGLPAAAADGDASGPSLAVSRTTGLDAAGATVTVTGSGFDPVGNRAAGVYVALGPQRDGIWTDASLLAGAVWVHPGAPNAGAQAPMADDGSFQVTLSGLLAAYGEGASAVDCLTEQCGVITFAAHGSPDRSQDTFTPVSFAVATGDGTTADDGTVADSDGDGTTGAGTTGDGTTGDGTAADDGIAADDDGTTADDGTVADDAATGDGTVTAEDADADVPAAVLAAAPALSVSPTTGLAAGGATVNVSGTGYNATANGNLGVYVVFGPKNADYATNANAFGAAVWVHPGAPNGQGQAPMASDGSFATTLNVKATYTDGDGNAVDCMAVPCMIMTIAAHGAPDRSQDVFVPVSFAAVTTTPVADPPGADGAEVEAVTQGQLPFTGAPLALLTVTGVAAVAAGAGLVLRSRRGRERVTRA